MKRVLGAVATCVVTALGAIIACGPGDLSDLTRGEAPVVPEDDSGLAPIATCKGAVAPPPPDASNEGKLPELIFAFDNIRIDSDTSNADAGLPVPSSFNLDRNCSCGPEYSCLLPEAGRPETFCDDETGRDNVTGKLLADLSTLVPTFKPQFLKERINAGAFSVLVSILEWNGQPEDPRVIVGLRMSTGNGNPIDPANNDRFPPKFDGTDIWAVDPGSIATSPGLDVQCTTSNCVPKAIDLNGYVTGNKLVASMPVVDLAFATGAGRVVLPFVGVTLVADLSGDGANTPFRLDGQIAGRWPADAILGAAGAFNARPGDVVGDICTSDVAYGFFKTGVCASADLAADPANDNKRGVRCGALSEAVRFTAVTATMGTVRAPQETPGICRPPDTCP